MGESMQRVSASFLCLVLSISAGAGVAAERIPEKTLSFDLPGDGTLPQSWSGRPAETIALDDDIAFDGPSSVRLRRNPLTDGQASVLAISVPVDFAGETIELSGFLRTDSVTGLAALWLRQDGAAKSLVFDNMAGRSPTGTTDWQPFTIQQRLHRDATKLVFGVVLSGTGTLWADGLSISVDDEPLNDRPVVVRKASVLETDTEFMEGSGVEPGRLSPEQIDNLTILAKVWGFLKYHHPAVTDGRHHWDFELFRIMPGIIAAESPEERNELLVHWIESLGPLAPCDSCASPPEEIYLAPDLGWLRNEQILGRKLSVLLNRIHRNRPALGSQFYVTRSPASGKPVFHNELGYDVPLDGGYRLLALFRYWNAVQYWFPYRDLIGRPWEAVLRQYIPAFAGARQETDYHRALARLVGEIGDSHAAGGEQVLRAPPAGRCFLPIVLRFIGDAAVVAGQRRKQPDDAPALERGDQLLALGELPVNELVALMTPHYPGSNRSRQHFDMAQHLTRGDCGPITATVDRNGETMEIATQRVPATAIDFREGATHELPGPVLQRLDGDISYLKLSGMSIAEIPTYVDEANNSAGLIIDARSYPAERVDYALGGHLVRDTILTTRYIKPVVETPGAFAWDAAVPLQALEPTIEVPVTVLVDEVTMSQAEGTALAYSYGPRVTIIGSQTAGANGNVTTLRLPGGATTRFSGIGVFDAEGRQTQRIGIVPDVVVRPTRDDIRAGRDPVIARAIEILRDGAGLP